MAQLTYQTNSRYLDEVVGFFRELGIKQEYETLKEPPASGKGRLV